MQLFSNARRWGLVGLTVLAVGAAACTGGAVDGTSTPTGNTATVGATTFVAPEYAATTTRLGAPLSQAAGQSEGIWVNGAGSVSVEPDLAVLSLGVETQEVTVAEAREKAATAMQGVIDALKAAGIDDADIQTQSFRIQPMYHYEDALSSTGSRFSKQVLDGYRVTNTVVAKIRDLSRVGEAIDATAEAGGDATRFNSINFQVEDTTAAEAEARALAMQAAVTHAQQLADAAGVALGAPIFISESGGSPVTQSFSDAQAFRVESASLAAPTPIQVGEIEVIIRVQAVFGIG